MCKDNMVKCYYGELIRHPLGYLCKETPETFLVSSICTHIQITSGLYVSLYHILLWVCLEGRTEECSWITETNYIVYRFKKHCSEKRLGHRFKNMHKNITKKVQAYFKHLCALKLKFEAKKIWVCITKICLILFSYDENLLPL